MACLDSDSLKVDDGVGIIEWAVQPQQHLKDPEALSIGVV